MTKDEALDLALEALEESHPEAYRHVITAIKQARSAPEQKRPQNCGTGFCSCIECVMEPAPVQEPVAYLCENAVGHKYFRWKKPLSTFKPIALYTTPPAAQRQWVGLSDLNIDELENEYMKTAQTAHEFLRAIEANLRSKNTP